MFEKIVYVPAKSPEKALDMVWSDTGAGPPWVFDERGRADRQAAFLTTSQQAWEVFKIRIAIEILED